MPHVLHFPTLALQVVGSGPSGFVRVSVKTTRNFGAPTHRDLRAEQRPASVLIARTINARRADSHGLRIVIVRLGTIEWYRWAHIRGVAHSTNDRNQVSWARV